MSGFTIWNDSCILSGMSTVITKANQLERRLISFASAIVALSSKLPKSPQGRHICGQILRSGTAVAANYGEARGAESRADLALGHSVNKPTTLDSAQQPADS